MVSELDSRSSRSISLSPGQGHFVMFLGKTLNSHSASLHLGVQIGTSQVYAGGNPGMDFAFHLRGSRNIPSCFMIQKME